MLKFFKKNHRIIISGLFLIGFLLVLLMPSLSLAASAKPPSFDNSSINFRDQTLSSKLRPGSDIWTYFGPAWDSCLALANIIVIIVLAFLAIVNIAHVNYDTYTVKKALPALIVGIIMSNFSLLICRMILDVGNVLTNTFTGGDIANRLFDPLMQGLGIAEFGTGTAATGLIAFFIPGGVFVGVGMMILTLILVILPVIAAFVLIFLLYIRVAVLIFLAAVAPLAFIMYGFPPTQGLFKQWWSNWIKWVFMKPIMFFILWLAASFGGAQGTGPGGFSLVIWLICLALTFFAFTVPFKMGGAVMGAWGNVGKKGLSLADYGILKGTKKLSKGKWAGSPMSMYQGMKAQMTKNREDLYGEGAGYGRDYYNRMQGKKSHYGEIARESIALKNVKEMTVDVNDESGEAMARTFTELLHNKQYDSARALLLGAAKNNQVTDIMREMPAEAYEKMGLTKPDMDDQSLKGQYAFVKKTLGDRADAQFQNRLGEAFTQAGYVNGKQVFVDTNGNEKRWVSDADYAALSASEKERAISESQVKAAHILRARSKTPMKFANDFRIDGFQDKNKELNDEFFAEMESGLFTEAHYDQMEMGRFRPKFYEEISSAENWAKLENRAQDDGAPGSEGAKKVLQSLQRAGYGPKFGAKHAEKIVVDINPADPSRGREAVNIETLDTAHISDEIQRQLQQRLSNISLDHIDELNRHIQANVHLDAGTSPNFRAMANQVVALRKTGQKAIEIQTAGTRADAEAIMDDVARDINANLVAGIKAKVDPQEAVGYALQKAGPREREALKAKIRSGLEANTEVMCTTVGPTARNISVRDAIEAWQTAPGAINSQEKQLAWSADMDALGLNTNQKIAAWKVVNAFEGIPPQRTGKRRGRNDEELYEELGEL